MQQTGNFLRNVYVQYLLLIAVSYFIIFFKLGNFPFRLWDESMFAVNAYEMAENGNYMVPYFDHAVDWRNSKPLLLTWIQVGLIKTVGFSELTMRLPSALAVMGSILLLFHFLRRQFNDLYAWIASLILLTSHGYITYHTGRTGDADALLSFFLVGFVIYWANWLLKNRSRDIFISFTFLALALLTKSFAALPVVLPVFLFTIFYLRKKTLLLFTSGNFYAGSAIVIGALLLVFYVRELYQPGYLQHTFSNDVGRLGSVMDGHAQGWDFYLETVFYNRFVYWSVPFFLAIWMGFNLKNKTAKMLFLFALSIIGGYFILLSFSVTKLIWYDTPMYPLMAAVAALPIYFMLRHVSAKRSFIFTSFATALVFFIPYRQSFFRSQGNAFAPGDRIEEMAGIFLHNQLKSDQACDITVYHRGYSGSLLCYQYMYADLGLELTIQPVADFSPGEKVFVSQNDLKQELFSAYVVDTIAVDEPGIFVKIKDKIPGGNH